MDTAQNEAATAVPATQAAGPRTFRLVVFAVPDDRETLQRELRRHLELNPVDARIAVHNLPGMLPEHLTQVQAEAAAAAVRGLGVEAQVIAEGDWPNLGHTPTVHHVRCMPHGLEVVPVSGAPIEVIAWERIALISIAEVPLDGSLHVIAPGTTFIRATPRIKSAEVETRTLHGAEMWILCEAPFRALRIDHREMNYEYLAERLVGSAAANFVTFARDLTGRAKTAWLTPTTRAFLDHRHAEEFRLESMERHRTLVQLNVVLMRRARSQSEAPSDAPNLQEIAMTTTVDQHEKTDLRQAHADLDREVQDLKEWCREVDELGKPRFGELGFRLETLRSHVARHFEFEEQGGYMAPLVEAAPQLAVPVETLLSEHRRILARFDEVAAKLKASSCGYDCWSEGQRDVRSIIQDLERHEHAENELWQSAFEMETGAGD